MKDIEETNNLKLRKCTMRVFAAPGKKKPLPPRGPKVVNNIGGNGKNFLSNLLGAVVNTVTLPIRLVGSIFKGKGRGKLGNLSGTKEFFR